MKKLRTRILGAALAVALALTTSFDLSASLGGFTAFAEENTDEPIVIAPQEDINRDEELPAFEEPVYTAMFSFPAELRGVYVTPTVDYAAENSTEAVADEVETLLDNAESNRLNAVMVKCFTTVTSMKHSERTLSLLLLTVRATGECTSI